METTHQQPHPGPGSNLFGRVTREIISLRSACAMPHGARVVAYRIEEGGHLARLIFSHNRGLRRAALA